MFGLVLAARLAFAAQVATAPAPASDGHIIVRLVSRANDISIVATSKGVRYSATDKLGHTLVSNATLDELKANHPAIHRLLSPAICDTNPPATIYAGLDAD